MTTNRPAWLSPQGCEQVRDELERLLLEHRAGFQPEHDADADADAWARHRWRERRIRHLQELLLTAEIGSAPPDDGLVEAGMLLTVQFDGSSEEETVLLGDGDVPAAADVEVYSTASPIGRALLGAIEGETRTCQLPAGRTVSVTVLTARPYRHDVPVLE
ncbi:GreA/GreB family elongation factor [Actinomycetospora chibensis]|uniref:GreA/GreB family elongation factor n=1 Tax=Actinomycetospora chibensis TaxID=663606 RepID=A0ABV9RUJ2_9PSEU|nr:GreA/GreB family elongation factor [Actinomycetospora chibensis]MDD7923220.1 GreA/GreB family elongation factor [Actinomycetospora chibensis]